MTPVAQRIAIAKACGWKKDEWNEWLLPKGVLYRVTHRSSTGDSVTIAPPDYLSDLNAMHEVEKVLTKKQWFNYVGRLHDLVMPDLGPDDSGVQTMIHATAAQRAEAFLRTIGKWSDS